MTTLNALKRSFFIVQPRNGSMSGGYSELARAPKGSILTLGLNWSPIVKDIYDTTVSSSLWSQSGNTVSVVNAANDAITTQIDVTVHAEGKTVLENKVTLANGIVLVHYIIVQGIDLNKDVTSVAVPVDGSGLDFDDTFATLQVDGVTANTVAPTLDFDGTDFAITEAPDNDFDISIKTDAVTFAKMQNIATDKLIGRVSSGTGDPEEVTCTDFAQSLLDDTDAATARATLGLGSLAAFSTVVVSGQSDVVADAISDTLTLVAGTNVTITTNASTDSITIASTGGGTPGGSSGQIQYNNAGAFGGDSGFTTNGAGSVNISGDLDVDNLNLNGNTLSSTNTDGNIVLDPNGTGTVNIDAVNITGGAITGITDLAVADGGTGRSSATAYAVVCGGTTATGALQSIAGVGTSGQVLTSNGAGALPTFQNATGGTKPAKTFVFNAPSFEANESNPASIEFLNGTVVDTLVRAFDDTTEEYVNGKFTVPTDIDTSGTVTFKAYVMAKTAAASKNIAMTFAHVSPASGADFDPASYTEEDSGNIAINGTQDNVTLATWTETVSNLGWAAGDLVIFRLSRDPAATNDLTGDMFLFTFEIDIPRA